MVSWHDVKAGHVSLAEIVQMSDYLDMMSDVEYFAIKDAEAQRNRGRR